MKRLFACTLLALLAPAQAEPALIFEPGGRHDRSFGQAAWEGAERWKRSTGLNYQAFEIAAPAQREQAARRFAEKGANPVVGVGFPQAAAIDAAARDFPNTRFAIVDMVVARPNVQSFVFREHEGAYLAGLLAARASKSGVLGFVGGQDVPLIRKVLCGYEQGAKAAKPGIRIVSAMAGTTVAAWTDPARGAEMVRQQAGQGADVIFAAAGTTGLGALQAVKDLGLLGIGVDSNQNGLHPGRILTSLIKRTDVAVEQAFRGVQPGVTVLGLKEGGLDLAFDEHNAALVTATMRREVEDARAAIIAGRREVVDASLTGQCR